MSEKALIHADMVEAKDYSEEELREVIFGESQALPKTVAVTLLAKKDYPDKLNDLQRLLNDEAQEPKVRHSAALALGRLGTRPALQVLRKAAKIKDPYVQRGVQQALEETPRRTARARKPSEKAPTWGETLETYRKRKTGPELPFPEARKLLKLDPEKAEIMETPVIAAEPAEAIEYLASSTPNRALSPENSMAMRCSGRDLMFLFENLFAKPEAMAALLEGKASPGVVAVRYGVESQAWTPKYHVLTQPSKKKGEIQLILTTPRGVTVLAGKAQVKGTRAEFNLRAVNQPGAAPTEIEGVFEDGALRQLRVRSVPGAAKKITPVERKR